MWFALHTFFGRVDTLRAYGLTLAVPVWSSIDWSALALSLAAMLAIFRFRLGLMPTLAACSVAGALVWLVR